MFITRSMTGIAKLSCPPTMFRVLHSSAGAGKTHALVKHYLTHCLGTSDHGAYRHVLALTFTNKAAAEMKGRVIGYLEGLAKSGAYDGALADVADQLKQQAGIDDKELGRRASVVLSHMLHHWEDVAISTIDAFTRRVVKPFARDLRMDQDLRMTTEQDHYRQEAVNTLIDRAGDDAHITELLTQACSQLLLEERPWDPTKPLMDLSRELLNERSIGPLMELREWTLQDMTALMERLNKETKEFRDKARAIGRDAVDLFERAGIRKEDIAYSGAIVGYFRKLADFSGEWPSAGPHTRAPIEKGKWNSAKATADTIAVLQGLAARATALFNASESLCEEGLRTYQVQRSVARELLPTYALHSLDTTLEELKNEDGVAFFSDLTRRVAEVVKNEPVPFIYERLGERYRHFLIDEFQDTSLLQWNALLPLLENALSTGGSVLLVGDGKQAIYRWRNGEVRLFVELPSLFGLDRTDDAQVQREATLRRTYVEGEPLAHNRRSAQRVIAFNNALFNELPSVLSPTLQKVYHAQEQQHWRNDLGTVRITLDKEKNSGAELQNAIAHHALSTLKEALANGYAPGDVAVLVRSKRTGRLIAEHLLEHGFPVLSPDGLQLAADPAVQLLVECLRHLVQGDDISAARALQWHAILSNTTDANTPIGWSIPLGSKGRPEATRALKALLTEHRATTLKTSLTAFVDGLARGFGLSPGEDSTLLTFLDETHAWSTANTQDIIGFLEHWDRTGGDRSNAAADGANAIQVMTVHKSKGLEFPVVIVPDARMVSSRVHSELLWMAPGDAVPELEQALVRESTVLRELGMAELTEEHSLRELDALNLLYVAFTRASKQLHVFVPHATDTVTKALTAFVDARPDLTFTAMEPAAQGEDKEPDQAWLLRDVATPEIGVPWSIRTEGTDARAARAERDRGTTLHAIIAATTTAADLPAALANAVARGALDTEEAQALEPRLAAMIGAEPLFKWFAPGADVRSEAAIITTDGHGLRPDRVLRDSHGTHVLEIKTGQRASTHAQQLRTYLDVIRSMDGTPVTGLIWYLMDGGSQPVT